LFPVENASIITELPAQTPNIIKTRNSLQQKDNLVLFITLVDAPFDNGAKDLHKTDLLSKYKDVLYERAKKSNPFLK